MNLEELGAQVTLLEDIQDIENLQRLYGYYLDAQKWSEVLDLFSENAESVEIADHGVFLGKQGVRRLFCDLIGARAHEAWSQPLIIPIGGVVDVDPSGKTAKGRWQTWIAESIPYGGLPRQQWQHGYYINEYVKENGKWLIKKLHWNVTFWTTYEAGWLKVPLLGYLQYHPTIKPDAPPTAFHPYPSGYHVPYHYKHPITGD